MKIHFKSVGHMVETYSVVDEKSRQQAPVVGHKNLPNGFPIVVWLSCFLKKKKKDREIVCLILYDLCYTDGSSCRKILKKKKNK